MTVTEEMINAEMKAAFSLSSKLERGIRFIFGGESAELSMDAEIIIARAIATARAEERERCVNELEAAKSNALEKADHYHKIGLVKYYAEPLTERANSLSFAADILRKGGAA